MRGLDKNRVSAILNRLVAEASPQGEPLVKKIIGITALCALVLVGVRLLNERSFVLSPEEKQSLRDGLDDAAIPTPAPEAAISEFDEKAAALKRNQRQGGAYAASHPVLSWGLARIHAAAAWKKTKGAVAICVVGSGMSGNVGLKVEGGYNVEAKSEDFTDDVGQGTGIAGIIASVAPEAAGIIRCSDRGFKLIDVIAMGNKTVGKGGEDSVKALEKAVDYAAARGALVISPAGAGMFTYGDGLAYPARFSKVVAVSGSRYDDNMLPEGADDKGDGFFAASGRNMSFIAPGMDVLRRQIDGTYGFVPASTSGSDAAAACVTGLAALYLSLHPGASPDEIKEALAKAATPLKDVPIDQQGSGMIDAAKLVAQ